MHPELQKICTALDELSNKVGKSFDQNTVLNSNFGWHHVALTIGDLAAVPADLSRRLKDANPEELSKEMETWCAQLPGRLSALQPTTVQHMINGHGQNAIPAYLGTLQVVEIRLRPLLDWKSAEVGLLPPALNKRLQATRRSLETVEVGVVNIAEKVNTINDAYQTAEELPETLTSLKETQKEIERLRAVSEELKGKIAGRLKASEESADAAKAAATVSKNAQEQCIDITKQCAEVLSGATAHGLAFSFEESAKRLRVAMAWWVAALICALVAGGYFGAQRFEILTKALQAPSILWAPIVIELALALASLGGPIWLAWLATKQVGLNFRLSEDYAFKAAVAKAYDGFRRQVASAQNPEFKEMLLASALTRFDEAPLRWASQESHGSPWHELLESEAFREALKVLPSLKTAYQKARKKAARTNSRGLPADAPSDVGQDRVHSG